MPEVSTAMMNHKLDTIEESGAGTCVVCDVSCMTHLNGGLIQQGKQPMVKHLAQVLAHPEDD
jgi:L-lactate dehydrogenase complex protein LldE